MAYQSAFKKVARILLYILGIVLLLVCAVIFFVNIPYGKKVVKNRVQSYLSKKLQTKVEIGAVDYSLPKWIEIKNVYIEDQNKDTLIYGEEISADISMLKLLRGNTDIGKLFFKNIFLNVARKETDSVFNFQFVLDAFTGNKPTSQVNPDTAALKLSLDRLIFDNVALRFKDDFGGSSFATRIKYLDATLDRFQPDKLLFVIRDFKASGVDFFMSIFKETPVSPTKLKQVADTIELLKPGLLLTAGSFDLRDVNVTVDNKVTGMYYSNEVTHLNLKNTYFDMIQSRAYSDRLQLDSSFVQLRLPKETSKDSSTADGDNWIIKVPEIHLANNRFIFDDENKPAAYGLDYFHLNARDISLDGSFEYSVDTTMAGIKDLTFKDTSGFILDSLYADVLFSDSAIIASGVYLKTPGTEFVNSTQVLYNGLDALTKNPGESVVNAKVTNSRIAMNDLYMLVPAIRTSLPPAEFGGQTIFVNAEMRGTLARVYLPYFQLSGLSGSSVNGSGYLTNVSDPDRFGYDLNISNSKITRADLMKFVPNENKSEVSKLPAVFYVTTNVRGNKTSLVADVRASGGDMKYSGRIALQGIGSPGGVNYDFDVNSLSLTRDFIYAFIPPGTIPPNISIPQSISASGSFKGTTTGFTSDLKMNTSYGGAYLKGYMRNMDNPNSVTYDMFIALNDFDLGKFLQDTMLQLTTLTATARGRGFDYLTMRSDIDADIAYIGINRYNYHDAVINSDFNNGVISGDGIVRDSSLKMNFDGSINVKEAYPSFNVIARVDTARLQQLNLYDERLDLSLTADINANSLQPGNLDARFFFDSMMLRMEEGIFPVDTISLLASSANGVDDISLYSPFANANAKGRFQYDKVGTALLQYIDHYYDIGNFAPKGTIANQQMAFNAKLVSHPLITTLVPDLNAYDSIKIDGNFVSDYGDSALNFTASTAYLSFLDYQFRNGKVDIDSKNERIGYAITFDTLHYGTKTFFGTAISGGAANDSLAVKAITQDNNRRDWFGLDASLFVDEDLYTFRLNDNLLLNYETWTVDPGNFIVYSNDGVRVNNFIMRSDTASISINSQQPLMNSPIDLVIDNFNLKSIASIISTDTLLAAGIMDARMTVTDLNKKLPGFTGNAQIAGFSVMGSLLGDVNFTAQKVNDNNVAATLTLTGNGNDLEAEGNYYLNNSEQQFDAMLNVRSFNVATIQPFTSGMISNARGNIHGSLALSGKIAEPEWDGMLVFDTTRFTLTEFGTPYQIIEQRIDLAYPEIVINDFRILDSLNNVMTVDGAITSNSVTNFDLDLYVNASEFILLNAPKAIDNEIYGYASVDANLTVSGNSETPEIEGDIFINDNSNIYLVIPQQTINKDAARTVVRFIDQDTFNINPPKLLFEPERDPGILFARFLNYNLNVEITRNSTVTIIVDPVTGDELSLKGDAQLNAGVDPGGNLIVAGNYELEEGHYVLNYQFLQRRFNLLKGGTVLFVGEPMDARIDVWAEYIANTSARDLLANEVSTVSPVLANSFNQRIPFKVLMHLTGVISKPDINFDIQLPDEDAPINSELRTTIENKLMQIRGDQAATNKQVFSLLLFNRFVGEESSDFFKGNSSEFNDLARQSVSQFLSAALNEIASDLFKGIDIDLNLNTYRDFSGGGNQQRTDLNIALSKSFLDDRLIVSVGTNIGIEGQDPAAKAGSNYSFMPDVTFAYKLTKDGRYMIRAYRKNQFEVVLDGYVVENGVGFIVTMNYDKFRELFKRK